MPECRAREDRYDESHQHTCSDRRRCVGGATRGCSIRLSLIARILKVFKVPVDLIVIALPSLVLCESPRCVLRSPIPRDESVPE